MIEPMTPPSKRNIPAKTAAGAAAIAAAVLAVTPFLVGREGVVTKPYADPVGIKTVCVGETQGIEDRIYSRDECMVMLRNRMTKDYAPVVLNCVPALVDPKRTKPFQALLDLSYNIGAVRACKSPSARYFNAGQWTKGCDAFRGYFTTARGVKLRGLVVRREGERLLCREGLT